MSSHTQIKYRRKDKEQEEVHQNSSGYAKRSCQKNNKDDRRTKNFKAQLGGGGKEAIKLSFKDLSPKEMQRRLEIIQDELHLRKTVI